MRFKHGLVIFHLALLITMSISLSFSTSPLADHPFGDSVRVVDDTTGKNQYGSESVFTPNGTLIVAWGDMRGSGCAHIFYTRSFDGGLTYEPNRPMIGMTYCNHSPSLAVSPNGTVYLGFIHYRDGTRRVFSSKSTDDWATFSAPVRVTDDQGEIDVDPEIAVDGLGNVHLVFVKEMGTGFPRPMYWDVFYSHSTDDGATWSPNIQLNDDGMTAEQRAPMIAADALGHVYATWGDFRTSPVQDFFTYSNDTGQTFSPCKLLDGSGTTIFSGYPFLHVDSGQALHVTFSASPVWPGKLGIYHMKSTDFGVSFSAPVEVSKYDVEHQQYPEVEVDSAGKIHLVWTNLTVDTDTFYANSTDGGMSFNPGFRVHEPQADNQYDPSLSISASGGMVVTWTDQRNGDYDIYSSSTAGSTPSDLIPPSAPTLKRAVLTGPGLEDVELSWNGSKDEGVSGGTVMYELWRATEYLGPYSYWDAVAADGSPSYTYIDSGAGDRDPNNYFYRVYSVDASYNRNATEEIAGKFVRVMQSGVQLISIPLVQENESLESVLQTVKYDKAWYYDSSSKEWKWHMTFKSYRRGLWIMDHTMGLWVNVTEDSNLTVAGMVPTRTTIHLHNGWNLVSFPSFNASYTINNLRMDSGAVHVEGYDSTLPYGLRVLGDVEALQAGHAYWVRVDIDVDWLVEVA